MVCDEHYSYLNIVLFKHNIKKEQMDVEYLYFTQYKDNNVLPKVQHNLDIQYVFQKRNV